MDLYFVVMVNLFQGIETIFQPVTPHDFFMPFSVQPMGMVFSVMGWFAKVMTRNKKVTGFFAGSFLAPATGLCLSLNNTAGCSVGQGQTSTYLCEHTSFDSERDP